MSDVSPGLISADFFEQNDNYSKFNLKPLLFIADLYIYFLREVFLKGEWMPKKPFETLKTLYMR
jgi:hypothetical protein